VLKIARTTISMQVDRNVVRSMHSPLRVDPLRTIYICPVRLTQCATRTFAIRKTREDDNMTRRQRYLVFAVLCMGLATSAMGAEPLAPPNAVPGAVTLDSVTPKDGTVIYGQVAGHGRR
jgi:hypothetical protein